MQHKNGNRDKIKNILHATFLTKYIHGLSIYYLEVACNFVSLVHQSCIMYPSVYTRVGKGVYIIIAKHYTRFLMDYWNTRV